MKRKIIPTGMGYIDANVYLSFNNFKIIIRNFLDEVVNHQITIKDEVSMHLLFFQDGGLDITHNEFTYQIEPETFVLGSLTLE